MMLGLGIGITSGVSSTGSSGTSGSMNFSNSSQSGLVAAFGI